VAGVLLGTLLLCACATPPQTRLLLTQPPPSLRGSVELTDTPFYPQERYQCGPAALATVLAARDLDVTPQQLMDAVFVPALHGSLPEEIAAAARRYGMLAYRLQPSLEDLLGEVGQGNPVLVLQNLGTDWLARWHFAVVIGYDLASREVVLRSGTTRRWRTALGTFERTWARSGYWALVILPAGNMPASARLIPYLQAAHDLETTGQTVAAQSAYRAATRQWPDASRAWLALGNNLYAAAEYAGSERAFREATRLAPGDPQGWNNLAYALLKTACPAQARAAAACAQQLAREEPNYRDTVAEIAAMSRGKDAAHCLPVTCSRPE
jgi:tetratricopeptide (TPR) repeat protein